MRSHIIARMIKLFIFSSETLKRYGRDFQTAVISKAETQLKQLKSMAVIKRVLIAEGITCAQRTRRRPGHVSSPS